MLPAVHRAWQALPARCPACGLWTRGHRCTLCLARFAAPQPRCLGCGMPRHVWCNACHDCPPASARATQVVVGADYGLPWDGLVSRLKFQQQPELAAWLAPLLAQALDRLPVARAPVDWVVPVPLAPRRLQVRGYNQAWEVARRLAGPLGLTARPDLLLRWRDTDAQTGQDGRQARLANLQGAFMPAPGCRDLLAGRQVALVDDVLTTGATLRAASQALREAGVAGVCWWVVTRTP
ncbi:ComF family protein [Ideonella sp. TBM-1]|uniref:ComF family protein n=1 Tax=Ideonella livida TaxID=2707176 RepID=A0A7C9PI21_9BURK|nr:ComF family protein [Ideonella livida]